MLQPQNNNNNNNNNNDNNNNNNKTMIFSDQCLPQKDKKTPNKTTALFINTTQNIKIN